VSPKKKKSEDHASPSRQADRSASELRTAPRFGFGQSLPYRVVREPEKEEEARLEKAYLDAVAKNISLGGLCMRVTGDLRPGTVVEVQIPSVFSDESVTVEAQVMWCDKIQKDPYIGVAFQSLTDEASVSIQKLIRQLS